MARTPYHFIARNALRVCTLLVVLASLLLAGVSSAQIVGGGGIQGIVTDSTGASVAGAAVSITHAETGVVTRAVSSSQGSFNVTPLAPGHYDIAVQAPGFQSAVESGVLVEITKISSVTLKLNAGAQDQTVVVHAESVVLDTSTPEVGTTIEPVLVRSAPLEVTGQARQIDAFIFLAPGVQGNSADHNINGGVTYENEILFNGIPVAQASYQGRQTAINPPFEMVDEFHVSRATFSSQYGLGQGAVTYNMTSGTNKVHGDVFEILKNTAFDSAGFFPTRFSKSGRPEAPVDQQHDYGFTVSGPVFIPKLYNGRDKTFFLFSSDWFRLNSAISGFGTVPTAAEKNGDFSAYTDSNGNLIPIYDPTTGLPFKGNIIPTSRFSGLSASLLSAIPNPDHGAPGDLINNKLPAVTSIPIRQHLWGFTLDHTITPSQSVHYTQWLTNRTSPNFTQYPIVGINSPLSSYQSQSSTSSGFLLNYVKTLSSKLVTTVGADRIGEVDKDTNPQTGVNFAGVAGGNSLPSIFFDGNNAPTSLGAAANYQGGLTNNNSRTLGFALVNNWVLSRGRHTLNIGGEFRHTYQSALSCIQCGGSFFFSKRTTSNPQAPDPNNSADGNSFASFLLGQVDSAYRIFAAPIHLRNKAFSPYLQDDFKLNRKLTINAGLRWDLLYPFTETQDQVVYVDPQRPDPSSGNILGAATKFGDCSDCAHIHRADLHLKNFGPRLGLSYALNKRTVLQAGFFVAFLDGGAYEYGTAQTSFYYSSPLNGQFNRNSSGGTTAAYGSWDANALPNPGPQPFTPSIGKGNLVQAFDPKRSGRAPYNETWTASVQRELPYGFFLNVAYVGNKTLHLPSTLQLPNQPDPSVLALGNDLLAALVTDPKAVAAGIKIPYPSFVSDLGGGATVLQALRPYPQYTGYFNNYELDGTSAYNALQLQAEKRLEKGLSFVYSLTLSRNNANVNTGSPIFANNGLNRFDLKNEFAPSFLDQFYNTKFAFTYELPFGPGKQFLNSHGLIRLLTGGWQASGILDYEGGTAFGVANYAEDPLRTNGFNRPSIAPGQPIVNYSYSRSKDFFTGKVAAAPVQFNTNAFIDVGNAALGNAKRAYASLRNPAYENESFDLIKHFAITERVNAVLRFDLFNAFNRTILAGADNNQGDITYTRDPVTNIITGIDSTQSNFGKITYQSTQNRRGQATFRVEF